MQINLHIFLRMSQKSSTFATSKKYKTDIYHAYTSLSTDTIPLVRGE